MTTHCYAAVIRRGSDGRFFCGFGKRRKGQKRKPALTAWSLPGAKLFFDRINAETVLRVLNGQGYTGQDWEWWISSVYLDDSYYSDDVGQFGDIGELHALAGPLQ